MILTCATCGHRGEDGTTYRHDCYWVFRERLKMPHDKRGTELQVGDTVMVPCLIKAIHLTEDYCNVDLETKLTMPPDYGARTPLTLNSRQTIKPTASHRFGDVKVDDE